MSETEPQVEARRSADLRYALHLFRKNPLVLAGLVLSVGSIALALLSPFLVNSTSWQITHPLLKNCWNNPLFGWGNANIQRCPSPLPLGTDSYGRNLLTMIVLAIPVDLQIALEVVLSAVVIGIVFGATASYAGGIVDEVILRITDIFLAVPGILLAIVFMVVFGRTIPVLTGAVLLIWWPTYVRLVRSQVLSEKERPYVESLRSIGAGRLRILFRHVVPNSIYPLLVQATLDIGSVILTVSALTFIGLSPSPLLPELGNLASLGSQYFFTAPWLIIFPGLTILLISLGFNLLGDGLRDILDPRLRR
ncbi:MAG TPA: ABC transporter permease [Nitrososphaerales archaeon]|nr:ABC transporter permease [Nitrososphaerales archaeon]